MQDLSFIVAFLRIVERTHDIETSHFLSMFIKPIAPIVLHEIASSLQYFSIKNKDEFLGPEMCKFVQAERNKALKDNIFLSKRVKSTIREMGVNFNYEVFDNNVVMSDNKLVSLNFDEFHDRVTNQSQWNDMFSTAKRCLDAFFLVCGLGDDCNIFFKQLEPSLTEIAKKAEALKLTRYSYSTYSLFSKSSIENADKVLILYRYRVFSSISVIESLFPRIRAEIKNYTFYSYNFFRKIKAEIIETFYKEIESVSTPFTEKLKVAVKSTVENPRFFPLNRKIRGNLHYRTTLQLNEEELAIVDAYQDKYINTVLKCFNDEINVCIDKRCRSVTGFYKACYKKNISADKLNKYLPLYYLKWVLFRRV